MYLADCLDSRLTQFVENGLYILVAFPYGCQGRVNAADQHFILLTFLQTTQQIGRSLCCNVMKHAGEADVIFKGEIRERKSIH